MLEVADADVDAEPEAASRTKLLHGLPGLGLAATVSSARSRHPPVPSPSLLFFNPYQAIRLRARGPVRGWGVRFHANFLCIETHHQEVGCNGVLFNDVHSVPLVALGTGQEQSSTSCSATSAARLREAGLAHAEALVSYLKILLVKASRWKLEQQAASRRPPARRPPAVWTSCRRTDRGPLPRASTAPASTPALLHLAPKSLAKLVKRHLHKTLTELIRQRGHQAGQVGPASHPQAGQAGRRRGRLRRQAVLQPALQAATGHAPTAFREIETAVRGGSNLLPIHFRHRPLPRRRDSSRLWRQSVHSRACPPAYSVGGSGDGPEASRPKEGREP